MMSTSINRSTRLYHSRCCQNSRHRRFTPSNALSDHSIRVRGDIRRVFKYLSDVRHYADFDSSIVESYKLGSGDLRVNVGTRFQVVHSPFPGISLPIEYEVAEYIPHKRIVFAGDSENFRTTKTMALMTHPAQKDYTVVRQIVDVKMKNWKSMIPMLDVQLAKREEASASKLEQVLNSKRSPLQDLQMDAEDLRSPRRSSSSSSGSYNSLDAEDSGDRWKDLGNMFGNFFNNGRSSDQAAYSNGTSNGTSGSSSYSNGRSYNGASNGNGQDSNHSNGRGYTTSTPTLVLTDPLGYYQVLGLDTTKTVSEEDIKSAFRAAAQQLHPDKMAASDDRTRQAAKIQFQILQAAYSTLKDPVKRNMYDRGQLSVGQEM